MQRRTRIFTGSVGLLAAVVPMVIPSVPLWAGAFPMTVGLVGLGWSVWPDRVGPIVERLPGWKRVAPYLLQWERQIFDEPQPEPDQRPSSPTQAKAGPLTAADQLRLTREQLARLRTEGVQIRNDGTSLALANVRAWADQVTKWADQVEATIRKYDPADAEQFKTLDTIPPPRIPYQPASGNHVRYFHQHDFRLVKLERLLDLYAERARFVAR